MRRRTLLILTLALLAVPLVAGDAWKKKPPAQWTPEEALEVLTDSPWAKKVSVWQVTGQTQEHVDLERRTYQDAPDEAPLTVTSGRTTTLPEVVEGVYRVQWSSAALLRESVTRLRQAGADALVELHGPPAELPAEEIVVTVRVVKPPAAPALPLWTSLDDSQLAGRTKLTTSDKREARPARVVRHGVGAGEAISFYFPRTIQGQPAPGAQTKWVEFSLESRYGDRLKVRFKLGEMQVNGRPDY